MYSKKKDVGDYVMGTQLETEKLANNCLSHQVYRVLRCQACRARLADLGQQGHPHPRKVSARLLEVSRRRACGTRCA